MALKLSFIFSQTMENVNSKNVCKKFHAFGRKCAICQNFDTIPAKYLHKFAYRYAFQVDNT